MADAVFDDENDALTYIRRELETGVSGSLAAAIAGQFVVRCLNSEPLDDWPRVLRFDGDVVVGAPWFGPWTVRGQELCDIKELAVGIAAALSTQGVQQIVALTISAGCMIWRLRRRGVSINPLQRDVLVALRSKNGIKLEELTQRTRSCRTEWTAAEVESALSELAAIRLMDGTVVPLVHRDSDGRWSTDAHGLWEIPFGSIG